MTSDNINPDEECPVCLGQISNKCRTLCRHHFCKVCIVKVLYPSCKGNCPVCRSKIDLHTTNIIDEDKAIVPPKPLTIYGSIYIQGKLKGVASYHFDSPDNCYISYESSYCDVWPRLQDGSKPPKKKPFLDYVFNLEERTFTGNIKWPISWESDHLRCYKMIFSEDFNTIVSGKVQGYDAMENGRETDFQIFGTDLFYERLYEDHIYD